ncbi:MAG: carbon monoxide dehydrogenase [Rhodospirillaceae bacterium]|nr:carbon monoxide dehydrogenase [Rhodospirillaceae bacterium]|tara:strand:+ start:27236 stop:29557 length:2322 start_codon:yes stop_codon:yes gene_type:complete
MKFGVGQSVPRSEDPRFLTGRGTYIDDIVLPRMAYAAIVYAQVPHADLKTINTGEAEAAPGVIAVLTGANAFEDGIGGIPPNYLPQMMGLSDGYRTEQPVIVHDRIRFVGERIAVVVAESDTQARDAAALVTAEFELLDFVTTAADAISGDAKLVHDGAQNNIATDIHYGDTGSCDAAFEQAAHTVDVCVRNNRLACVSIEPRGCIGDYNEADDRYVLYNSCQGPHMTRTSLAQNVLKVPESRLRVISRDVGGGFGMKGATYPEDALVLWASKRVGRPVKWISDRSEAMLADNQGRDQVLEGSLALDKDGKFLALRWRAMQNAGAYIPGSGYIPLVFSLRIAPSIYEIPIIDIASKHVFTNTTPTSAYRGAGRPEGIYAFEQLIDKASRVMGIDRVDLRRRNMLQPDALPHTSHTNFIYDSGDFSGLLNKCTALADWNGFAKRRESSEEDGRKRGIGISYYVDDCGNFNERADIRFDASGSCTIFAGTFSHGQGHATVYAQMVSEWLGIPFESIQLEQGDTASVAAGRGTVASRSMVLGGSAMRHAADDVIENGKKFAAHLMEADPSDIEFAEGVFTIVGTDRSMSIIEVAKASFRPAGIPQELGVGLDGTGAYAAIQPSFPNGCHICEVEIDTETGTVDLVKYTVVDDIGVVINPMLADGQIHGGIAQGVGQALTEDVIFDKESGQLMTGSLMDYAMPFADTLPSFEMEFHEVPCKSNPIGVKGAGEGGTVGATPAVISAILDALAPLGVKDIEMPATSQRVWKAIESAQAP